MLCVQETTFLNGSILAALLRVTEPISYQLCWATSDPIMLLFILVSACY